jgi:hypothetical protein
MCRPAIAVILSCLAGEIGAQVRHWDETRDETIWRRQYTNCDKGWAVDLPPGVVAHGSLPPNPNHGFLISAANPGTTTEVNLDGQRIIDIYDEYDAMELGSARAYLDWELKNTADKKLLEVRETMLQGLRGVQARYEVKSGDSAQLMETLIFLRRGVVYHLLLKTTGPTLQNGFRPLRPNPGWVPVIALPERRVRQPVTVAHHCPRTVCTWTGARLSLFSGSSCSKVLICGVFGENDLWRKRPGG